MAESQLSTELSGYQVTLQGGAQHNLTAKQGQYLIHVMEAQPDVEYIKLTGADGQVVMIKRTWIGVIEQQVSKVTFQADW